ncbi:PucR family transcriptional regulator [Fodinicola acaciae]|uniref:PucR family transcriptional regulator n=1 Tax=Fodinicola acaciae TaxID=2681555 RepID=UPI0013D23C8E|nr:PucR family transcriptional regulator [Fodinicola acaciae]
MTLTVRDLLEAPSLGITLVNGADAELLRPVRWVAVTELADPRPFLTGGELVLTTGLRQRGPGSQREFVRRLAERDIAALGFGTGLSHPDVPDGTLAAAEAVGMLVLDIPYETPFIAVDRYVADWVLGEHFGRVRELLDQHDVLARALLSGQGLGALVAALRQMVDAPVMVADQQGTVLASAPSKAAWPVEQLGSLSRSAVQPEGLRVLPVEVEDFVVAYLCTRRPRRSADVLPYAVSLVGLELARRQAVLSGQRQLAGQVLADVVRGSVTAADAERRLTPCGIDATGSHAVVIAIPVSTGSLIRRLTYSPLPLPDVVTAVVDDSLVAVLPAGQPAHEAAHLLHTQVRQLGGQARIGIGGWYAGVSGLRWSYYEAREAASRGLGVNEREPMSLSGLILASEDIPLRDLATDLLRPLVDFDAAHDGALIATLRAYLDANGSVGVVAQRLILHRNTVRYRIAQIEKLTGRSLAHTSDRVQFWLALTAAGLT